MTCKERDKAKFAARTAQESSSQAAKREYKRQKGLYRIAKAVYDDMDRSPDSNDERERPQY